MKIVVLDGFATNSGDLSWAPLEALGELTVYDRTAPEDIVERCRDKQLAIINKTVMSAAKLEQLPQLRYIGYLATGYNTVDLAAADRQGIVVTNARDYSSRSVAQHTIAMLLELCNRVAVHAQSVAAGDWVSSPDWTFRKAPLMELHGKKMGIVGLGNIGQQTARIAMALGMEILACNPRSRPDLPVRWVDEETLFIESDVISLHCPLTPQNEGMVHAGRLRQMKSSAILLNTARGPLIVERDLAQALHEGEIAAAGLDVLSAEPPAPDNPLLTAPHCLITPHIAWATTESRSRLIEIVAANVAAFLAGNPQSVVNKPQN